MLQRNSTRESGAAVSMRPTSISRTTPPLVAPKLGQGMKEGAGTKGLCMSKIARAQPTYRPRLQTTAPRHRGPEKNRMTPCQTTLRPYDW